MHWLKLPSKKNCHIYPEDFQFWEWLDDNYAEELEEHHETVWANLSTRSKNQKYRFIDNRLFNDQFNQVSQEFINMITIEGFTSYYVRDNHRTQYIITNIKRLAF